MKMSRLQAPRWPGAVMVAALLAVGAHPAAAQRETTAVVTAAVQVTDNPVPIRAHSSPQLARNPENGDLVIVEADVRGTLACNVHLSINDGRSWFLGANPMPEAHPICAPGAEYGPYASIAFAPDGVLYLAFAAGANLERGRDNTPRHLYLARSTDSGRTFSSTIMVFEAPEGDPDKGLKRRRIRVSGRLLRLFDRSGSHLQPQPPHQRPEHRPLGRGVVQQHRQQPQRGDRFQ